MFGSNQDIPSAAEMHISKFEGGVINTDTCNDARLTSKLLAEAIEHAVSEKFVSGGDAERKPVTVLRQDCHHHMCNVWIGAVTKQLSSYLNEVLACD